MKTTKLLFAAFAVSVAAASSAVAGSCAVPGNAGALISDAAAEMNRSRAAMGQRALARDSQLEKAAQRQACWLAKNGKFQHYGSGGSTPARRVKSTGYCTRLTAENIALGQSSGQMVNSQWMASPHHKDNILNRKVREYGLGVAMQNGRPIWVAVYAKPC